MAGRFATMSRSFDPRYVRIGVILKPRGIRGELKVQPLTDDPHRFEGLKSIFVEYPDGKFLPMKLMVNRIDSSGVYLYLTGIATIESAEKVRGLYLCVEEEDAVQLPEGTWFIKDLEGMAVYADEEPIGTLMEVLQTGGVDVYRIKTPQGKYMMFPALRRVIQKVEVHAKRMWLKKAALDEVCVYEN